ncbi:MAG: hypothetical protein HC895_05170 [Leptolyngbyaceae cyanobacterium SM1_3_5]|nr:hypothetical protein [Leptolyngbyaceae cyanobacterium SM1_3_5]
MQRDLSEPSSPSDRQSALNLSDVTDQLCSGRSIQTGGLTITHTVTSPSEIETAPSSQHFLCLNLRYGSRQVNQFDGGLYEGAIQVGDFFLLPAGIPAVWAWETAGEGLAFMMNPDILTQTAAT